MDNVSCIDIFLSNENYGLDSYVRLPEGRG